MVVNKLFKPIPVLLNILHLLEEEHVLFNLSVEIYHIKNH
jgi:hypothetical protein